MSWYTLFELLTTRGNSLGNGTTPNHHHHHHHHPSPPPPPPPSHPLFYIGPDLPHARFRCAFYRTLHSLVDFYTILYAVDWPGEVAIDCLHLLFVNIWCTVLGIHASPRPTTLEEDQELFVDFLQLYELNWTNLNIYHVFTMLKYVKVSFRSIKASRVYLLWMQFLQIFYVWILMRKRRFVFFSHKYLKGTSV